MGVRKDGHVDGGRRRLGVGRGVGRGHPVVEQQRTALVAHDQTERADLGRAPEELEVHRAPERSSHLTYCDSVRGRSAGKGL